MSVRTGIVTRVSPSVVTLTYAPAAGVDVEHLVAVAAAIRSIFDRGPLY